MLKLSEKLGYKFSLPDSLTVDQLDDYQGRVSKAVTDLKGPLTDMRWYAVVFAVAVQVGWLAEWECAAMPDPRGVLGPIDAKIVIAVGKTVRDFVRSYTDIDPN